MSSQQPTTPQGSKFLIERVSNPAANYTVNSFEEYDDSYDILLTVKPVPEHDANEAVVLPFGGSIRTFTLRFLLNEVESNRTELNGTVADVTQALAKKDFLQKNLRYRGLKDQYRVSEQYPRDLGISSPEPVLCFLKKMSFKIKKSDAVNSDATFQFVAGRRLFE